MSKSNHITGRQISAALGLARMSQAELAKAANISIPTIGRMLASDGPVPGIPNNVVAVRAALEAAGIEFLPENGGGVGVRLRKAAQAGTIPAENLNAANDE